MTEKATQIKRPKKWDHAFSNTMNEDQLSRILDKEPFLSMIKGQPGQEDERKSERTKKRITELLLNESRLLDFETDEIVVRQGDYGATAYFIVEGEVQVLFNVDDKLLGRSDKNDHSIFKHVKRVLSKPKTAEARDPSQYSVDSNSTHSLRKAIFLQDIPSVIKAQKDAPEVMGQGELFGEIGALSRSIRSATITAKSQSLLLEIKWQGLRDLLQVSKQFKQSVDDTYRRRSLRSHLISLEAFQKVPEKDIEAIVSAAEFETYGKRDWNTQTNEETPIIKEGDYASALMVLRAGFVKITQAYGHSEKTTAYLSKGGIFGLEELISNTKNDTLLNYQHSVYALGYTDVVLLPASLCQKHLFPFLETFETDLSKGLQKIEHKDPLSDSKQSALLDFFVKERFINGTKTMLINLDRCTGCDDCVRACADNHDNNPRFIRHGKQHENLMIANACMHCEDPVCMIGCPTGAIHRIPTGEVIINDTTCIGCQTCANSCPYENIRMVEIRDKKGNFILDEKMRPINKATKCDLCYDNPVSPACQNACPHDALKRVNLDNDIQLIDWLI